MRVPIVLIPFLLFPLLCIGAESPAQVGIERSLDQLPLYFVANAGQFDHEVAFCVKGADKTLFFTSEGITFSLMREDRGKLECWALKLDFVDAGPVAPRGEDRREALFSYFEGRPADWKTGIAAYGRLVYEDLWPGIDLVFCGSADHLKYEFIVEPGADANRIGLRYGGVDNLEVGDDGALIVSTPFGGFEDGTPFAYQMLGGVLKEVSMRYVVEKRGESFDYRFELGDYDADAPLVLDPDMLLYCGYIGDGGADRCMCVAADDAGSAYVTGYTVYSTFPVVVGPDLTPNGSWDAFVAKVSPDGTSLVYCGYIGGGGLDYGYGIDVDGSGNAYVIGNTSSSESTFPVLIGPDLTYNGGVDAFIAKVNAAGTSLDYCGYIGGDSEEWGQDVAVDSLGNAYVSGDTQSTESTFPATVGPDLTYNGGSRDAFVAKVAASGAALEFCGYIGGTDLEYGYGVTVGASNNAYVVGITKSTQTTFPAVVGPDLTYNGGLDAFIAKVNTTGTALEYCGYIGGEDAEYSHDVALDSAGNAYIGGYTQTTGATFPAVVGPGLNYHGGLYDAFVAKINSVGTALLYCGYLGGAEDDRIFDITVDASGHAYVTGETTSPETSFPVESGPDLTYNGNGDVFVAKVNATGSALIFCGYIGGAEGDYSRGIALDGADNTYIAGFTWSYETTFPVLVGPDLTCAAGGSHPDAFVVKLMATGGGEPPVVTITSPADGAVVGSMNVVLEAEVASSLATTVTSNPAGISTSLPAGGGTVSGTIPLPDEGPNTLVVSATDTFNNVGSNSITVIRDTIFPAITIVSPLEGSVVGESPVTLTVNVVDASGTTVSFGTNAFTLAPGGGQVIGDVDLTEGSNTVAVAAIDEAGNESTANLYVVFDLSAPIVTIDSPLNGAFFGPGGESISVVATIDDLTETQVASQPAGVSGMVPAGGGIITGVVALAEGSNQIAVTATDATLREGSASVGVTLDTTSPTLSIVSPQEGDNIGGLVEFTADASDDPPGTGISHVELSVDGDVVATPDAPPFSTDFDTTVLNDGLHTFSATAYDNVGNTKTVSISVYVDNTAPQVVILDPLAGDFVSGTMDLQVEASDAGSGLAEIEVLCADIPPSVDPSRLYAPPVSYDLVTGSHNTLQHPDGALAVSALAIDDAGNESFVEVVVFVDNTAPDKLITTPLEGEIVSGVVPITVEADDPNLDLIEIYVDGELVGSSGVSPFTIDFDTTSRLDGDMLITARVTDLAQNESTYSITVTVDNMSVRLCPRGIVLFKGRLLRFPRIPLHAKVQGVNTDLLLPIEDHDIALHVPGGSPVPAVGACDTPSQLKILFDRKAFANSIRAGIQSGVIPTPTRWHPVTVKIDLVADGFVIGTVTFKIRDPFQT